MEAGNRMHAMNVFGKLTLVLFLLLCLGMLHVSGGGIRVQSNGRGSAWYRFNGRKRDNREVGDCRHL